jgi:hypothetical protein
MNHEEFPDPKNVAERFQKDFIKGCLSFLSIAAIVRGDMRDAETIFNEMMDPIIGNRDRNRTGFDQIMPEIFMKVIEYCSQAIEISEDIEKEMQND